MKDYRNKSLLIILSLFIAIFIFGCSSGKDAQISETKMTEDIQVLNLGKEINSDANDYSFKMVGDGKSAFFTSSRKSETKSNSDDDIWVSQKTGTTWSSPKSIGSGLNTEKNYELGGDGSSSISFDGKTLYFASSREEGVGNVDIYSAESFNGTWGNVKNLGSVVNSKWFDSHPSISPDNKYLYFTSDRPGGFGGTDLWCSELGADGQWKEPVNLGSEINTNKDESSPYLAADNVTLYFSSNGHPGYGKHDLFMSRKNNVSWSKPLNLGKPINTEDNDRFPYVPATGNYVYFSSDKNDGFGNYDVYIAVPNPKPPKRITTIAGIVTGMEDQKPLNAKIQIRGIANKDVLNLESDKLNGKYRSVLPTGNKFEITVSAEGYNNFHEMFDVPVKDTSQEIIKNISLSKVKKNLSITVSHVLTISELAEKDPSLSGFMGLILQEVKVNESLPLLNYIFFDKESGFIPGRYKMFKSSSDTIGFDESRILGPSLIQYYNVLNVIGSRMKKFPQTKITLVGCNDNLDKENGNIDLSKTRATSIQDYLVSIWGIDKNRIKIITRNLPEVPSPQNTSDGQSENRRVEILSDSWDLMKPVSFGQNELIPSPEKVLFNININSDKSVKEWTLNITQDGQLFKKIMGNKNGMNSKNWDWKNTDGAYPTSESPFVYSGSLVNTDNETATSYDVEIPVKKVMMTNLEEGRRAEKQYEKISLILFDFNKYDLNAANQRVLDLIYNKITADASVEIYGYTDDIGTDEANLDLSNKRAKAVFDTVKRAKAAKNYYYEGLGKTKPLYNNLSPEGRFYNRTVQVIVERDVK